jgi:NTP pyrophosphatase (non-canonical NTP hydrolase)
MTSISASTGLTEDAFDVLIAAALTYSITEGNPSVHTDAALQAAREQVTRAARHLVSSSGTARLAGPASGGLGYVQQEAWDNKLRHGFNTTDVPLEIAFLFSEAAEVFDAWRRDGDIGAELADVVIFAAGLAQMTGVDLAAEVTTKLAVNAARAYKARPNGTHERVTGAGDPQ